NKTVATIVLHALDAAGLDTLLKSKWAGMKGALGAGDIPAALQFITFGARSGYEEVFRAINTRLPMIDSILTDVTPVETFNTTATYDAIRIDAGVTKVFSVRFVIDSDGLWRLQSF